MWGTLNVALAVKHYLNCQLRVFKEMFITSDATVQDGIVEARDGNANIAVLPGAALHVQGETDMQLKFVGSGALGVPGNLTVDVPAESMLLVDALFSVGGHMSVPSGRLTTKKSVLVQSSGVVEFGTDADTWFFSQGKAQ